ncbi:MAG: hypothetical protein FWD73_15865 [Polyangiaceae bacterium]|nr:hypothetical protein [Polyangiaceae bacterium]
MLKAKLLHAAVLVMALLLAAVSVALTADTRNLPGPVDDTYIVFVYAKHVLHDGIAYFSARDVRVEGFTSALDLLVKLPIVAFAGSKAMIVSCAVSCAWLATTIVLIWWRTRRYLNNVRCRWFAVAGLAFIACDPLLAMTGMNSLETPLYVLTGVAFLFAFAEETRAWVLTTLALLFALSRPEALGAICGLIIVRSLIRRSVDPRDAIALAAPAVVLLVRRLYFGYWAPNTYYAKRSATLEFEIQDGLHYLQDVARVHRLEAAIVASVVLLTPFLLYRAARSRSMPLPLVLAGTSVYGLLAAVYGGGDGYVELGRFVVLSSLTATLSLFLWALEFLSSVDVTSTSKRSPWLSWVVRLALIGFVVIRANVFFASVPKLQESIAYYNGHRWGLERGHECDTEVAMKLEAAFPHARIGQTDFQRLKFHNDRLAVEDLSGLNDVTIAHRVVPGHVMWGKFGWDVALERSYDILFIYDLFRSTNAPTIEDRAGMSTDRQLALFNWTADKIVFDSYEPASIPMCGVYYNFLVKKGLRAHEPGIVIP